MKFDHASWLQRLSWVPVSLIIYAAVQTTVWVADREPPFHVLSSRVIPPSIPGAALRIEGQVWRDTSRHCDAEVHHWVEDHLGFRHYLQTVNIPAESIHKLETDISPGQTKFSAQLPLSVAVGPAVYHAENRYICNPVHVFWPVSVITRIPFEVSAK
jgi:hypothetical protein